ncbi:MAG: T9SS type A sorting domain-containing protein [Saprospiraceae bacterium]|nr:T9SS type A sorting domain-containing protein [Saprospiraceae bacterium]
MKKKSTLVFIALILSLTASATDFYWKGGSGNFNDPAMWWLNSFNSGQTALQAPISTDNVYFVAAAFTTPGAVVTINSNANCDSMIWDNNITAANAPTLAGGTNAVYFDIYGSIEFAANMTNIYNGHIRLKAVGTTESILTRGVKFRGRTVVLDGTATTEWHLLDDFDNSYSATLSGGIRLTNGKLFSNGHNMIVDRIKLNSNASQTTAVDFANSTINVRLEYTVNGNTANYLFFALNGTVLHLLGDPTSAGTAVSTTLGQGLFYENVHVEHKTNFYQSFAVDHLYADQNISFITNNRSADINNFHASPTKTYSLVGNNYQLNLENYFLTTGCSNPSLITSTTGGDINKQSTGVLDIHETILQGIGCDTTGGRIYNATNSTNAGGNSTDWNFILTTARTMFFRPTTSNSWHLAANWQVWNGVTFVPNTGCPPTPNDDVYFDALSFPGANLLVEIDSNAFCRDMRWLSTVVNNSSIDIRSGAILNCYGSTELTSNMDAIADNGGRFRLYGNDPDTLYTADIPIYTETEIRAYAFYHIIGNFTGSYLDCQSRSRVHADGIQINAYAMRLDSGYFHNVYAHLTQHNAQTKLGPNTGPFYGGQNMDYQGTTTFELTAQHPNSSNPTIILGENEVMPNVIPNSNIQLDGYGRSCTAKGDMVLKENLGVYWSSAHLRVLGTMPLYEGDLYVTAGKTYSFNNGSLTVADTLHSIGTCTEYVNWSAATSGFNVSLGGDNIEYTFITGWQNNSANPTIQAVNSIDGGNNTNVNFPISGTGLTYYWRADATDATDFEGDWNDPNHWTTNQTDLTGTLGGCLPTLVDTVIFDNLSFSASSNGCTVTAGSYCKTMITTSNITFLGNQQLYIANSIFLDPTTIYNHTGDINFVGSGNGDIDTDGVLVRAGLKFSNGAGDWNFVSDHTGERGFFLYKGAIHSNGFTISKHGFYAAAGTTLDIRNSTINVTRILPICCYTAWNVANGVVMADNSFIDLSPGTSYFTSCNMGNNTYNDVRFFAGAFQLNIRGNAEYSHVDAAGICRFFGNNSFDSLTLHGNRFYYFNAGTTQTLNAPHGEIIIANNAGPGNFVNIETVPAGGTSYFHKEYGTAFCVDWVKVAGNEATKGTIPPAAWAAQHQYLQFETGSNSDNINGSATGIWAFNLPPILTVASSHVDTMDICTGDTTVYIPISLTGTYPYSIIYSWTDIWGNTGIDTIIEMDDDSNVLTPYIYNLALNPWTTTDYTIDVAALRCGGRNYGAPITPLHLRLPKDLLVATNQTGSCVLNNNSVWAHFVDDIDQRPMLSILDSIDASDTDALGLVNVQTNFDATVQYWNGKPYLPRHWKIDPANTSTGGRVRLYFTQAELNQLGGHTFNGMAPNVGTDLILWKFTDTITVGTAVQIPFTVIPLTGRAADPFSNTTDIYAIEFEVSSFSSFMLQPTDLRFLPLDILSFDATSIENRQVALNWITAHHDKVSYFAVERSLDGIDFEELGEVSASSTINSYQYLDNRPFYGMNYYRLRIINEDGTFVYSKIRSVEIKESNYLEIAPNPITNHELKFYIISPLSGELQLNIFDAIGRLVVQNSATIAADEVTGLEIDVQHLNSGIYTLQVINSRGETRTRRFKIR